MLVFTFCLMAPCRYTSARATLGIESPTRGKVKEEASFGIGSVGTL
jgi:hypothetical protein